MKAFHNIELSATHFMLESRKKYQKKLASKLHRKMANESRKINRRKNK